MLSNFNKTVKKHSATKEKKKQSPGTKRKIESVEEFRENNDDEKEDEVASTIKDDKEVQEDYFEDDGGSDDGDKKTETGNKKRKKVPSKKVKEMTIESIFLGGLDKDTTPITIKKFFKSHGVKLVDIRKKPKKRFGHCDLANNEDLEKAIQLNNAIIDGASIQIAKATGQRPVLSYGIDKSIMSGKRTVVVKNLSFKVTEDELLDLFKDSIAARIPKYTDSGKPRGKGFVDFPDANTARNAVNDMNNSKLHGRRIFVEFAPESGKNSKSERIAQLIKPEVEKEEVKTEFDAEEY